MRTLATLEDVAQRAGTSVATAGRALGGYGKVAAATRDRVVAAARQLNYHPNALARSMKQRSTFTIGLIIGNICNSFFARIVRAVETAVTRYGCKVIVCDTDEKHRRMNWIMPERCWSIELTALSSRLPQAKPAH